MQSPFPAIMRRVPGGLGSVGLAAAEEVATGRVTQTQRFHVMLSVQTGAEAVATMFFPVLPKSARALFEWFVSVTPTLGGGFVTRQPLAAPFPVHLEGNFGIRPKLVVGQVTGAKLAELGMLPLGGVAMTGFACAATLRAIVDLSNREASEGSGESYETYLYLWPFGVFGEVALADLDFGMRNTEPRLTTYRLTATVIRPITQSESPEGWQEASNALAGAAVSAGLEVALAGAARAM